MVRSSLGMVKCGTPKKKKKLDWANKGSQFIFCFDYLGFFPGL